MLGKGRQLREGLFSRVWAVGTRGEVGDGGTRIVQGGGNHAHAEECADIGRIMIQHMAKQNAGLLVGADL